MGPVVSRLAFPAPGKDRFSEALLARKDLLYLQIETGERIAALHIRRGHGGTDRVLLYSHGNAEDLGLRLPYLDMLSEWCGTDVLAYDYCGYGFSEGSPTEENCIMAVEAAYAYLRQFFSPNRIVAFGRSIGTGPTVDIAVRHPEIRGMVLQSPMESCGRVAFGSVTSYLGYSLDLFKNYEKIGKVSCPVLVIHGKDDCIVPWAHGLALQQACKTPVEPLWLENYGHNDLPNETCLRRIREFLDSLDGLTWGWNIYVNSLATHISVNL